MPKPKIIFDRFTISSLKKEISKKSGFSISTKSECHLLSDKISQKCKGYVSPSTLYRLYFKSDSHTLYKSTLDLLCNYAGYRGADHFQDYLVSNKNSLKQSGIDPNQSCNSLLFYNLENKSKKALQHFFENLEPAAPTLKWEIGIALFDELKKTRFDDFFYKNFSENSFVREFLFEKLHDPKFRLKNFENAYLYYVKNVKKKDEIKNHQDLLFGKCALFRYYVLTGKKREALAIGKTLYEKKMFDTSIQNELYIFPVIRYYGYKLWFLELTGKSEIEISNYAFELLDLSEYLLKSAKGIEKDIVLHTMIESIIYSSVNSHLGNEIKEKFKYYFQSKSPKLQDISLVKSLNYFQCDGILEARP